MERIRNNNSQNNPNFIISAKQPLKKSPFEDMILPLHP
jgi:hypothetical protein